MSLGGSGITSKNTSSLPPTSECQGNQLGFLSAQGLVAGGDDGAQNLAVANRARARLNRAQALGAHFDRAGSDNYSTTVSTTAAAPSALI
jgi:hypothetical protein